MQIYDWEACTWTEFMNSLQTNHYTLSELWNSKFRKQLIYKNIAFVNEFKKQVLELNRKLATELKLVLFNFYQLNIEYDELREQPRIGQIFINRLINLKDKQLTVSLKKPMTFQLEIQ